MQKGKLHSILFTRAELLKMIRGYSHPANDKHLHRLRLASSSDVRNEKKELLKGILEHCGNPQHYGPSPILSETVITA